MKNIKFSDKFYYSKQFIIFLKGFSKTDFKNQFLERCGNFVIIFWDFA